ncbi:MAG: Stp1/IreP family PP2C-type Ser/Thr phosphatase [Clostridia bacterium]|nr:Stp1/IreP family PP2C-type Ser/Thr phosphatase [Clostridia bacterium]MDD4798042.1 Stp1/IreP family PP2C-type Ser/Thr phosphatase [Clostridia bacterium]
MLLFAGISETGLVRENNEDAICIDEPKGFIAVADGIGGHAFGEVASNLAIDRLREAVESASSEDSPIDILKEGFFAANDLIYTKSHNNDRLSGMGTTLTAALLTDKHIFLAHIGDCRAYLLTKAKLLRLTDDHSLAEELAREGKITETAAQTHPQKHILTRSLGQESLVEPDCSRISWKEGDILLISSDGFYNHLQESEIRSAFCTQPVKDALQVLLNLCLQRGGYDNISAVVAKRQVND